MNTVAANAFSLEIVSDTICPWCYIGKKRLDVALGLIGDEIHFDVRWRPYQLNPDMPREGIERHVYRTQKFGSLERSQQLDAEVADAGSSEGLTFYHELMARTPNTLASHAMISLAVQTGRQNDVVDALFKAYFTEGQDIGDLTVLADIGEAAGLRRSEVLSAFEDEKLRQQIDEESRQYTKRGISGVPTVVLNGFIVFSGAQPSETMADILRTAAADDRVIAAGAQAIGKH